MHSWASSSPECPPGPSTTRVVSSPTNPRPSSSPSWCGRSCSRVARDELPHSITVVAEELEPERDDDVLRYEVKVLVERESQKGMVIGKGGAVIKEAGTLAREELEALLGAQVFLDTAVKVERDWQRRAHALDRLGY